MTPIEKELTDALVGTIQCRNDEAMATYNLPTTFAGFSGHFQGHPILPAVLQVTLGKLVCAKLVAESLTVSSVGRAKFMQEIAPLAEIQIQAVQKAVCENGERRFAITLLTNGVKASSFSLTCKKESGHA